MKLGIYKRKRRNESIRGKKKLITQVPLRIVNLTTMRLTNSLTLRELYELSRTAASGKSEKSVH